MKENTPYTPDIFNILKAVALLIIFGLHATQDISSYYPIFPLPMPAYAAIWILFALSGFLIGRQFYSGKYDTWPQIKQFYLKRFLRVGVPYYFALLIIFLFISPVVLTHSYSLLDWVRILTFTYNGRPDPYLGRMWFISTIMQLYIAAPLFYHLIFKKIPAKSTWLVILVLLALGFTARQYFIWNEFDWHRWVYTFSPVQWDIFFVPFVLNAYLQKRPVLPARLQAGLQGGALAALGLALLYCCHILFKYKMIDIFLFKPMAWYICVGPSVFTLLTAAVAFAFFPTLKNGPGTFHLDGRTIFNHPFCLLEAFGMITLSFYLYHSALLNILPRILRNTSLAVPGSNRVLYTVIALGGGFLIATAWAAIMYILLERPLNKWRKKLTDTAGL